MKKLSDLKWNSPAIHLRSSVGATSDNLWWGIQWRTTKCAQQVCIVKHIGQAKVSNLGTPILIQQNIFKLQVSVTDIVLKKRLLWKCLNILNGKFLKCKHLHLYGKQQNPWLSINWPKFNNYWAVVTLPSICWQATTATVQMSSLNMNWNFSKFVWT